MLKKVLIVDDVAINRDILSEMLEDLFETIEAENGQEALDLIDQYGEDISLILLDLTMPVMDGFAALEKDYEEVGVESSDGEEGEEEEGKEE